MTVRCSVPQFIAVLLIMAATGSARREDQKMEQQMLAMTHANARVQVSLSHGVVSLELAGEPLLLGATAGAQLSTGTVLFSDERYTRSAREEARTTGSTPGRQFIVLGRDEKRVLDWEWRILVPDLGSAAIFETRLINASSAPLELHAADALVAGNGGCKFAGVSKVLTNGRMYYDPGKLLDFDAHTTEPIDSFWNVAFHASQTRAALVAGFLQCYKGEGHIRAAAAASGMSLTATSVFHSRVLLEPGQAIASGELLLLRAENGHLGLETYADLLAKENHARQNEVINGWCTWFAMYGNLREDDILRNAEFIAREMKPYGMEWVQIDDGYQQSFGDWEAQPGRIALGMKGIADRIRSMGLKPGIWLAPFAISRTSTVAKEHPEWLARRVNGEPQEIEPAHQAQAQYILDTTNPGARDWLRDLCRTVSDDWGYDFIKTDFSEWTLLAVERFNNPVMSTCAAYRQAVEAMREGMGPTRHLLDCGPTPAAAGLVDSMRIELDRPDTDNPLWSQYAGYYNSTGPAVAKRYYYHGRTWTNDADHIRLAGLTLDQARAAATITAMSGGNMISSDRLYALRPERVEILKKVFPSFKAGAKPIDLFETDSPELFVLPVKKGFGEWTVAACFNWGDTSRTRELKTRELGLASGDDLLAHDFWAQQPVPVAAGVMRLIQPPNSVRLLAFHLATGKPQFIGTDRHFTQGGVELENVRWDDSQSELSGIARGAEPMAWNIVVYVPPGYIPAEATGCELEKIQGERKIVRARVRFSGPVQEWKLRFSRATP